MLRKVLMVATGALALALVLVPEADAGGWGRRHDGAGREPIAAPSATIGRGAPRVGDASVTSVPDGSGGTYVVWPSFRDGVSDLRLTRVTANGEIATGWPTGGLELCTARGHQMSAALFPDGSSGVIVGWFDFRDRPFMVLGGFADVYVQRVNAAGATQWTANGVKVIDGLDMAADIYAASDGAGGLFATWTRGFGGDAVALHLDGSGAIPAGWDPLGEPVCQSGGTHYYPVVAPDGLGGCYVCWDDGLQVFGQRFTSAGDIAWSDCGEVIGDDPGGATFPVACAGPSNSLLVFWSTPDAIVGQRLDLTAGEQWTAGGETIAALAGGPAVELWTAADGSGGAHVAWEDAGGSPRLAAQRVSSAGAPAWTAGGVTVSAAAGERYVDDVVPEAGGGVTLAWLDTRNSSTDPEPDLYAQRLDAGGAAQWTADGLAICTLATGEALASLVPDGAGGALLAWVDGRSLDPEVFAQRVSAAGALQFAANGKPVVSDPGVQQAALAITDGFGGTWVLWGEKNASQYDLRARRLDAAGSPLTAAVTVCAAANHQILADAVGDGGGGVVALWLDGRGADFDLYAQHLNAAGVPQWGPDGMAVCAAAGDPTGARLIPDGAGGYIAAWTDQRADQGDVYAQRLNGSGVPQWGTDGTAVCALPGALQQRPALVPAASNGAIVAWMDFRTLFAPAIYAQRLDGTGTPQWAANGVSLLTTGLFGDCAGAVSDGAGGAVVLVEEQLFDLFTFTYLGTQHAVQRVNAAGAPQWGTGTVLSDVDGFKSDARLVGGSGGGAIVAWTDASGGVSDVLAQRVDGAGTVQWASGGNVVCSATSWQYLSGASPDGAGGAVFAWTDERAGFADVYAQRLNSAGTAQWTADGVAVSAAARGQYGATLQTYPSGNTMLAWTDHRDGTERQIYSQALNFAGVPQWGGGGVTGTLFALAAAEALPGRVRVTWRTSHAGPVLAERRTPATGWVALGTRTPDGEGRVTIEDADVVAGERYAYRIGVAQGDAVTYAAEVWVAVPARLALAIEGLRPNPAEGDLTVAFTLPTRASARLELIDVSGRRVAQRDLSAFEPGNHVVRLDRAGVPAGLYFLRLTQGREHVTARASVVR